MSRMVNLEGKQVPESQLPNGSLFIKGCWYSSVDKLPSDFRAKYAPLLEESRKHYEQLEKQAKARRKPQAPRTVPQPSTPDVAGAAETLSNENGKKK